MSRAVRDAHPVEDVALAGLRTCKGVAVAAEEVPHLR